MKVLFLVGGDRQIASARLRAWQLADQWSDAMVKIYGREKWADIPVDVLIVNKLCPVMSPELFANWRTEGKRIIWDCCDPVWWWRSKQEIMAYLRQVDAVVVSNHGLKEDFEEEFQRPAEVILDRLPPQTTQRQHQAVDRPVIVWFGYGQNRVPTLLGSLLALQRLTVEGIPYTLRIIDDGPPAWPGLTENILQHVEFVKFDHERLHEELCRCDVALLPPYPGAWGAMKSNNKEFAAAWAGLPISDGDYHGLVRYLESQTVREAEGALMREWAQEHGDIRQSVKEWQVCCRAVLEASCSVS